jgi:hypothetical protein
MKFICFVAAIRGGRHNRTSSWMIVTLGIVLVVTAIPGSADACQRSALIGPVKSVVLTEALVDPASGKVGDARQVSRMDVSNDGAIAENTLYSPRSPGEVSSKLTAYFENGRLVRQTQVANEKTVATTNCSYDSLGRLVEAKTQSDNGERSMVETYEYGLGFIRRRAKTFSGLSVVNQTIDTLGRVVKEVVLDEESAIVDHTTEHTYSGGREEQCWVYLNDPRRHCSTTVRDSHGNEIEFAAEGEHRRTSYEYDSVGNWISRRTLLTGPTPTSRIETIVQRKIDYW